MLRYKGKSFKNYAFYQVINSVQNINCDVWKLSRCFMRVSRVRCQVRSVDTWPVPVDNYIPTKTMKTGEVKEFKEKCPAPHSAVLPGGWSLCCSCFKRKMSTAKTAQFHNFTKRSLPFCSQPQGAVASFFYGISSGWCPVSALDTGRHNPLESEVL